MKAIALGLLLLATQASLAAALRFDQSNSELRFTGDYQGEPVPGFFKTFNGQILLAENGQGLRFDTELDVGSLDTDYPDRDETLRGADFFAATEFPRARWQSSADCAPAGDALVCPGTLTLKGVSKAVPLRLSPSQDQRSFVGSASFNRLDFGIGAGEWGSPEDIGHTVLVEFSLKANP